MRLLVEDPQLISQIIVMGCFIGSLILILTDKINRAFAVLAGAIVTYFTVFFIEYDRKFDFILGYLFGTVDDQFVNLHALLLILGMLFIVQICHSAGVFQFLAFKLIQMTKGRPIYLLFMFCVLAVLISAILNNILTIMVIIPLTIVASRILGINPAPYIICEAIMVNVGGIIFPISSIPNILITTAANITFGEFLLNLGSLALLIFGITMIFLIIFYRDKLMIPKEKLTEVLQDFNVRTYVPDRKLFNKSVIVLLSVMIGFAVIPADLIAPDLIALTGGVVLIILSRLNGREILKKIDIELILYLLGIFVITGAIEDLDILGGIGGGLNSILQGNAFATVAIILWVSALLSSSIDNIPITKVLIPVVSDVSLGGLPTSLTNIKYHSLVLGANLGDNLTPLGDNILVMSIAEQNGRTISFSQFFRLGFTATVIQLVAVTFYYLLLFETITGLLTLLITCVSALVLFVLRYLNRHYREEEELIQRFFKKLTDQDYKTSKMILSVQFLEAIKKFVKKKLGLGSANGI